MFEIEKARGQIAITTNDIEKISEILNSYDRIIKGIDNKEENTIIYIKKYSDNTIYVVEVIPSEGNALKIKTMWKKPVRVANSNNASSSTSKTKPGLDTSTSSNSITQNNLNVKDNGVRAEKATKSTSNKTLIAQHNTSEEKLLKALESSVLPVLSVAKTKYQNPVLKYGDITLIFNKDTINPTDKRKITYNSKIYIY